jgi:hypothetical protein
MFGELPLEAHRNDSAIVENFWKIGLSGVCRKVIFLPVDG